jgi:hypothetical protein
MEAACPGAISFAARALPRHAAKEAATPKKQHAIGATTKMSSTKMTMAATAPEVSPGTAAAAPSAPAPKDAVGL